MFITLNKIVYLCTSFQKIEYSLIKNIIGLLEEFEAENSVNLYFKDLHEFKSWIFDKESSKNKDKQPLNHTEKMKPIHILNKLDRFHHPIFSRNIGSKDLINTVFKEYTFKN